MPCQVFGEQVAAWVSLKPGFDPASTEEQIRMFLKGKVAHFKMPQFYIFRDDFPVTITGKIQKYVMKEIAIKDLRLK